jgi:hypothetical protein
MHFEAVIKRVWRSTRRPRSSNSEIQVEAEIKLYSEMYLEAVIEQVWRCIWTLRSSDSEMHLEADIERVWKSTGKPRSSNS